MVPSGVPDSRVREALLPKLHVSKQCPPPAPASGFLPFALLLPLSDPCPSQPGRPQPMAMETSSRPGDWAPRPTRWGRGSWRVGRGAESPRERGGSPGQRPGMRGRRVPSIKGD